MNQNADYLTYKEWLFDSRSRITGDYNNPGFLLNNIDVYKIKVKSASVPIAWYLVDRWRNQLDFAEGSSNFTAVVPFGDYSAAELAIEVAKQMTDVGALIYSTSFSDVTGRITISANGEFTVKSTSTLGYILGLGVGDQTSVGDAMTFPYRADCSGVMAISIVCSNLKQNSFVPGSAKNVLCSMMVDRTGGGFLVFQNDSSDLFEVENNLTDLRFSIYDSLGNQLDLNSRAFCLCLGVYS